MHLNKVEGRFRIDYVHMEDVLVMPIVFEVPVLLGWCPLEMINPESEAQAPRLATSKLFFCHVRPQRSDAIPKVDCFLT